MNSNCHPTVLQPLNTKEKMHFKQLPEEALVITATPYKHKAVNHEVYI